MFGIQVFDREFSADRHAPRQLIRCRASVVGLEMPRCSATYLTPICIGFAAKSRGTDRTSTSVETVCQYKPRCSTQLMLSPQKSEVLLPSIGLANFVVEQPDEAPGFRVGPRDMCRVSS